MSPALGLLLTLPVLSPLVLGPAFVIAGLTVALLLARRVEHWPATATGAVLAGAGAGAGALWAVEGWLDLLGTPLAWTTRAWVVGCFAVLGLAAANFRRARLRRRCAAVLGSLVMLVVTGLGINAHYGLNPTLGSVLGVSTEPAMALPVRPGSGPPRAEATSGAVGPLWQTWSPTSPVPIAGSTGSVVIPGTVSGFTARPAGIYLPPAALTPNPPALPLVVLMMGQPGNPDPQFIADVLNRFASAHRGLAPIVIVADQLGNPSIDTLCLDTPRYGNVETYINVDVVGWARTHLNILTDRAHRTIVGYSHGGQCAISFAGKHPDIWGNVLDISGEEYPGAEQPARTLSEIFGGNQTAYDAQKPVTILGNGRFADTTAIFTVSTDDPVFRPGVKRVAAAAGTAGMTVTYLELRGVGHLVGALNAGLDQGFAVLYPRLGLARP